MTADDVAEVLGVSKRTAYTYIAQMEHIDSPRRATARGFQAWIRARTVDPAMQGKGKQKTRQRAAKMPLMGQDYHIPRRKEGAG